MVIKFSCPNGHPLSTTEARAGKPGKCPKCGAGFTVPLPEAGVASDVGSSPAGGAGAIVAEAVAAPNSPVADADPTPKAAAAPDVNPAPETPTPAAGSKVGAPLPPDQIMFLCPNGHKLNGPKRLQGKPGQCPHCGAKFRIPDYDAADEDASGSETASTEGDMPDGEMVGDEMQLEHWEDVEEVEEFPHEVEMLDYVPELLLPEAPAEAPPVATSVHALHYLVARLWRDKTGPMELVLKAGGTLSPQYFSPELSQHAFAVFGLANDDGTYNIAVVSWDDIARVNVQRLKQLPKGVFE